MLLPLFQCLENRKWREKMLIKDVIKNSFTSEDYAKKKLCKVKSVFIYEPELQSLFISI